MSNKKTIHDMGRRLPGLEGKSILTEAELNLLDTYLEKINPETFIEIGSWTGTSCAWLAKRHPNIQFICFDTFIAGGEEQIGRWLKNKQPNMILILGDSTDLVTMNLSAEIIFIDGDHTLEGCRVDLLHSASSLSPGGLLICHDYGHLGFGVHQAVDEMLARHKDYDAIEKVDSMIVIQDAEELDDVEESET